MTNGVLDEVSWPGDWDAIPFGRLSDRRKDAGRATLAPLSVFLDEGVVPRASRLDNYNRLGEDLSQYLLVEPGDLVFNKLRTWQGGIGVSEYSGIVSPAYFVCRPRQGLFPKFAHYALRSTPYLQELTRVSKWMPPAQFDIAWDDLREVVLRVPPLQAQRAIADYLDVETDRIDRIVSARAQQVAAMAERLEVEAATLLHTRRAPLVALRRIVDLLPGFSFRSEGFLADPGYARLLRGINVDVGALRWDDTVWVNESIAATASRFALGYGDIVIGMDRPVISSGVRVARVTEADLPSYLVQRVARLRAHPGLSQEYLYAVLRGPRLADHFAPVFTGVSVPHVSPSQILSFEIPLLPSPQQGAIVRELVTMERQARGYQAAARRQIDLLLERRQALITAAVTGQFEIPGVAA